MICDGCGKKRPPLKKTESQSALFAPYEVWVGIFGEQCGICGYEPEDGKKLHRDHEHGSRRCRGLLCFKCNVALKSRHTLDWLRKAVIYLERFEARLATEQQIMDDDLSSDEVDTAGHSAA